MKATFDKISIVIVAVGVALMALTVLTRVNPAEGSVVSPEMSHTPAGRLVATLLLAASLPGWGGAILCAPLGAAFQDTSAVWIELFLFQILGYWVLGQVISSGWRKWRRARMARASREAEAKYVHASVPKAGP